MFRDAALLLSPKLATVASSLRSRASLSAKAFRSGMPFTYSTNRLVMSAASSPHLLSRAWAFLSPAARSASAAGKVDTVSSAMRQSMRTAATSKIAATMKSAAILVHRCPTTISMLSMSL